MPDIFENEIIPPERPVFLKVLCMLTFIGSGYGILNSAVTYFKANDISNMVTEVRTKMNRDMNRNKKDTVSYNFTKKVMSNVSVVSKPDNLRKVAIGNFITSILCILSAILMWNLRRIGFYVYTLSITISIILPFYILGNNFISNFSAFFMGFIGILFVIFYAMNIKSMK